MKTGDSGRERKRDGKKKFSSPGPGYRLIFRRYRTDKNGKIIDAHKYGLRAWPMWVKD